MDDYAYRTDAADAPATWHDRVDRGALLKPQRRPDGTLLLEGFAAREGVLVYRRADGSSFRELVTADAIRTGASTVARAPVTLGHPPNDEQVTPESYQRLAVGDVDGDVVIENGGFTRVRMAVRRADAINAIEAGTQELSPGYRVRIDPTPGVHPEYGAYDARQVERVTNHLAIVDRARGGDAIRVRADGAYAVDAFHLDSGGAGGDYMIKPALARLLVLYGVTARVDSDDAAYEALAAVASARADSAAAEKTKFDALTAERDTEKARADKAEAKVAVLEADAAKRADAAARADLETLAGALKVDPKAHATTAALRKAIATAHLGGTLRADASDAYIDAVIDLAKTAHKPAATETADGSRGDTSAFAPDPTAPRTDARQPVKRLGPAALSRLHNQNASAPAADRGDK